MKLPALCLAAAFAGGIALGLYSPLGHLTKHPHASLVAAILTLVFFLLAAALVSKSLISASCASLAAWLSLGFLAALLASQPLPANHVLSLASASKIDLSSPLRWHGILRDEPAVVPWGQSLEISLRSVEFENDSIPTVGGMRLLYAPHRDETRLPELHSGDSVSFLAQARLPQVFRDEGAFDRRAYLQQQGVDLTATLRSTALIEKESSASVTITTVIARARSRLRTKLSELFPSAPDVAGILRAMLLGDRSFIDQKESISFQKTGVFHVLVVAGLHVGAFSVFLFWIGRKLRFGRGLTTILLGFALAGYVAVIEQRPPVLRAALMAAAVLIGSYFFRRLELLNSAAIAALILLVARPLELRDSSFQLSFLSIGCIAGIAVPWLEKSLEPYARALRGWRDVTRDVSHEPCVIQFRIDLRSLADWLARHSPARLARFSGNALALALRSIFRLWELVFLTLVLQIGMAPVMALDFHRVTLLGALANLVAVPITGILVPLGFVVLFASFLVHPIAVFGAQIVTVLTRAMVATVELFSRLPHGSYRIPNPPGWLVLTFFCFVLAIAVHFRTNLFANRLAKLAVVCTFAVVVALIATHPFAPIFASGKLELTVLDVGQGDSLFVVSPSGRTMLIDAGGPPPSYGANNFQSAINPGEEAVSPYLWSRGFKKIDVVALTHAHQDHLGGLPAILENFRVGALWIGREVRSPALAQLEELAHNRGIPVLHEARGYKFDWDHATGEILWPEADPDSADPPASAKNNDSLVMRIAYGQRSFLLPGDAESQAEFSFIGENSEDALRADVLKIGHHGSKNSTTPELLAAVQPQLAIISSGTENPYGHPSPQLLQRLEDANIRILRTDRSGAIHILTDGKSLEVSCFVACVTGDSPSLAVSAPEPNRE